MIVYSEESGSGAFSSKTKGNKNSRGKWLPSGGTGFRGLEDGAGVSHDFLKSEGRNGGRVPCNLYD